MGVYVDPLMQCVPNRNWKWDQSCHMVADSPDELHKFARKIGLRREWAQENSIILHYDLNPSKRNTAIKHGAIPITHRTIVVEFIRPARLKKIEEQEREAAKQARKPKRAPPKIQRAKGGGRNRS